MEEESFDLDKLFEEKLKLNSEVFEINIINLRYERQNENINKLLNLIKNNDKNFIKFCNKKELEKLLNYLSLDLNQLILKCLNDELFLKLVCKNLSILSSRQCAYDEKLILNKLNNFISNFNIKIIQLKNKDYIPLKNSKNIVNLDYIKKNNINKLDCLKSFDGKIEGKMNGFIFCKIVLNSGGHQDNVFEEASTLCEWIIKFYLNSNLKFFIIIDTNLINKFDNLKKKYNIFLNNIIIVNHIEFQNYIIKNY